jgi:mitofusin
MNTHAPTLPGKKTESLGQTGRRSPLPASATASAPVKSTNGIEAAAGPFGAMSPLTKAFAIRRSEVLLGIGNTQSLLRDLKAAPARGFMAQYPFPRPGIGGALSNLAVAEVDSQATLASKDDANSWGSSGTFLATPSENGAEEGPLLKVLGIDVKTNGKQTASLIGSLEASSVATLLQEKLAEAASYLDRLYKRVSDTSSKVFITGDLNAGKSTFVNALLRREVVPQDQQPCTTHFCEVVDANQNDGREEIHAIRDPEKYSRGDPSTFDRYDIRHLPLMVTENAEKNDYNLFKIYCHDQRPATESLVKNGLVDISLIDSPGLNIDSLKTTANFAKQEDIDVIVFMVHAENQFTLSVGIQILTSDGSHCYTRSPNRPFFTGQGISPKRGQGKVPCFHRGEQIRHDRGPGTLQTGHY